MDHTELAFCDLASSTCAQSSRRLGSIRLSIRRGSSVALAFSPQACVWGRQHARSTVSPSAPTLHWVSPGPLQALGPAVTLLCFLAGHLPKPSLQALPSALVPLKKPVTIRCQGPPGADLYRLEKLQSRKYEDQAVLAIPAMEISHAGLYRCSYQNGSRWSPPSENLELVATGVYRKPSLSAYPSSAVAPGGDVTLQCQTQYGFNRFALYKEGDTGPRKQPEQWYRADFPIITVTAAHSGTYRCYSFSSASPYLWSAPSNPLELSVTGTFVTTSQLPTEAPSSVEGAFVTTIQYHTEAPSSTTGTSLVPSPLPTDVLSSTEGSAQQHYARGNLVRMCLAAVTLILLAGLLAEAWHSRKEALPLRVRAVHRPLPPLPHTHGALGHQDRALPGAQKHGCRC
ncbi:platelet glycoprotein VI [Octodon degus]|uniref:Platelet glycoprotein VI n=1 Tax=Octodon degus TaxID=10160 RepID=A0A6P6DVJ2_OCTDE|nr:platelet glycoprotein VI [Octodon degus]